MRCGLSLPVLQQLVIIIIRLHCYAEHDVQPIAIDIALSVCLLDTTVSPAKMENRLRCCLVNGLWWAQGTMYHGGPDPPRGMGNFGGDMSLPIVQYRGRILLQKKG